MPPVKNRAPDFRPIMAGTTCFALVNAPTPAARALVAANNENTANLAAQGILTSQSYLPLLQSSASRDAWCAAHKGDAPPVPYAFGYASPWGYAF